MMCDEWDEDDFENDWPLWWDDDFEDFGCIFGARCLMPGLHFPSECHTTEMYEEMLAEYTAQPNNRINAGLLPPAE